MENNTVWLTLSEAQALLGVSRKTLYRYMDKKLLPYKKAANGRRYLSKDVIDAFLASQPTVQNPTGHQDYSDLIVLINNLSDKIDRQNQLLEIMIELYKPETMHELVVKHKRL